MGSYTDEVPAPLAGLDIIVTSGKKRGEAGKANNEVIRLLAESGNLLARGMTTIRDAHSWRSKAPVIRRATPQWFIAMDKPVHAGKTLARTGDEGDLGYGILPGDGTQPSLRDGREPSGLADLAPAQLGRADHAVRQRQGEPHTAALPREQADKLNANIKVAIEKTGVDGWFATPDADFFAGTGVSPEGWEKVTDVLDVWFRFRHDPCLRPAQTRHHRQRHGGRADVYMEGSDQHRGWFPVVPCWKAAPRAAWRLIKAWLPTAWWSTPKARRCRSRSANTIEPDEFQKQHGIEILRLWTASADYWDDTRISDEIIKGTIETYRKLRKHASLPARRAGRLYAR
jgi:isoleucyl-tRNA synthetase